MISIFIHLPSHQVALWLFRWLSLRPFTVVGLNMSEWPSFRVFLFSATSKDPSLHAFPPLWHVSDRCLWGKNGAGGVVFVGLLPVHRASGPVRTRSGPDEVRAARTAEEDEEKRGWAPTQHQFAAETARKSVWRSLEVWPPCGQQAMFLAYYVGRHVALMVLPPLFGPLR